MAKSFRPNVDFNGILDAQIKADENTIKEIPISDIITNPDNPRKTFFEIESLAESIEKNGLIQPIVVKKLSDEKYMIIAGERRFRAYEILSKKSENFGKIKCIIIKSIDNKLLSFIENVQRENLNMIEESRFIAMIRNEMGVSQSELAELIGKSREYIAKAETVFNAYIRLKVLNINDDVILNLSKSHIINFSNAEDEEILQCIDFIKENNFSVSEKELRAYLKELKQNGERLEVSNELFDAEQVIKGFSESDETNDERLEVSNELFDAEQVIKGFSESNETNDERLEVSNELFDAEQVIKGFSESNDISKTPDNLSDIAQKSIEKKLIDFNDKPKNVIRIEKNKSFFDVKVKGKEIVIKINDNRNVEEVKKLISEFLSSIEK